MPNAFVNPLDKENPPQVRSYAQVLATPKPSTKTFPSIRLTSASLEEPTLEIGEPLATSTPKKPGKVQKRKLRQKKRVLLRLLSSLSSEETMVEETEEEPAVCPPRPVEKRRGEDTVVEPKKTKFEEVEETSQVKRGKKRSAVEPSANPRRLKKAKLVVKVKKSKKNRQVNKSTPNQVKEKEVTIRLRQKNGNIRNQYGGGSDQQYFKKKYDFPTSKERTYFEKYTKLSQKPNFKRQNPAYLAFENPIRIQFTKLSLIPEGRPLHVHIARLIDILIRGAIQEVKGDLAKTQYWFQLNHDGYKEHDGWFVSHKTHAHVDGNVIMRHLARHMQSNKEIHLDEGFTIAMNVFKDQKLDRKGRGTVRSTKIPNVLLAHNFGHSHNRIVGASHCMAKAIAVGKLESDKNRCEDEEEKKKMTNHIYNLTQRKSSEKYQEAQQMEEAIKIINLTDIKLDQPEHDSKDLEKFATALPDYQIILWSVDGANTAPVEVARYNPNGSGFIGLFYHQEHYEYVTHIKGGQKPAHFCHQCSKFVVNKNHNKQCKAKCRRCGFTDCETDYQNIYCDKCNIYFRSQKCYDNHMKPTSGHAHPYCENWEKCKLCYQICRTEKNSGYGHRCYADKYCVVCKQMQTTDHECKHALPTDKQKEKARKDQADWRICVYDVESVVVSSGTFQGHVERGPKHKPNLICAQFFCSKCRGEACVECGPELKFSYEDPVPPPSPPPAVKPFGYVEERNSPLARFSKFLLTDTRANNAYIIAHNGGRYDHVMVLGELDRQGGIKKQNPDIKLRGNTIISAKYTLGKRVLNFRDSFNFISMPLSKMPAAFGLEDEAKGFFPYLYNHPDNYGKKLDTLPDKDYYSPHTMVPETRKEFDKWYEEEYGNGFELHREMLKYCRSDVRILMKTLIAFIDMCEETFNGWNPIVNGVTLPAYVMFVLKHEYIKDGDVGYVPEGGYGKDNNSTIALKYIQWLQKKDPSLDLQYHLKGGEKMIKAEGHAYYADAYDKTTKTVYEINGCVWHGCDRCYPNQDVPTRQDPSITYAALRQRTEERAENIKKAGYNIISVRECEINKMLRRDPIMKKFFKLNKYNRRLQPRDALYGGRTQVFRSGARQNDEYLLDYFDFVSMYPYLNAGGTAYPRGNPIAMCSNFPSIVGRCPLRGLVFCDVLPNPNAEMGYLPSKIKDKLMFVLCRTCGIKQNITGQCTHNKISERFLTGVWCTDELNKAIDMGYKVLKYHEIWYWEDKDWVAGGFFANYIKPLLALKHQATGWPRDGMTDQEKEVYAANIEKQDGVTLDRSKIKKNPALRNLTKIFLNSAWGKFGQNPIMQEHKFIQKSDALTLTNFFNDTRYEPTTMADYGEDKLIISRKPKKETVDTKSFTNLAIASITTSAARLKLTEAIERVGAENMVYCDTDSLIFRRTRGTDPIKDLKGDQLGGLTNEIAPGKTLTEVVAMAPKVYALKMMNENGEASYSVKAKGISLKSGNALRVNFDTMKDCMAKFNDPKNIKDAYLHADMLNFHRGDNPLAGIWTNTIKKRLAPNMDKGHYDGCVVTPYGQRHGYSKLIDDYCF